jgi:CHAT domain-containing protein
VSRTRLVVLAACDTGNGYVSDSDGVQSLARPFLAAGVPSVVATLNPVHDLATKTLLTVFHRRFRSGASAAEAMRQAQLSLLYGPDAALRSPMYWAPFQVLGAS